MKKLVWIGSFQSDESFKNMKIPNMGQASAYTSQKGIIKGIDSITNNAYVMDSINYVPYQPYPIYPSVKVETEKWSRTGNSSDICVEYINAKYITYASREFHLQLEVNRWIKRNRQENCEAVFVYAPSVGKVKAALNIKKHCGSRVYVIIPDIPEQISTEAAKVVRIAKKISSRLLNRLFKSVDGFILYSADMADYYRLRTDQWMLMEGVFDLDEYNLLNKYREEEITFSKKPVKLMYCGVMNPFRGTPELLQAFSKIKDPKFELHLVGNGSSVPLIKQYAQKDNRIIYHGFIQDRKKIIEMEHDASILLHIRQTDPKEETGYCFPSKLFEYLASGKPVISVKIPGIADEYFRYMGRIEHLSVDTIFDSINEIVNTPSAVLTKRCRDAQEYIFNNKTSIAQGQRIVEFVGLKG